jgi:hypothetical protein
MPFQKQAGCFDESLVQEASNSSGKQKAVVGLILITDPWNPVPGVGNVPWYRDPGLY